MVFKFNFLSTESSNTINNEHEEENDRSEECIYEPASFLEVLNPYEENWFNERKEDSPEIDAGPVKIKQLTRCQIDLSLSTEGAIAQALDGNTDIIPGVYEGGLEVWEGAQDMLKYLKTTNIEFNKDDNVLEVGCGAGLPGIVAYMQGASVDFQDFNRDVLRLRTIPNVLLNQPSPSRCRFIAGDWSVVTDLLTKEEKKYDIILTSDTIYNSKNHRKLLKLFTSVLKPTGKIIMATKAYYFGVGGTSSEFMELVKKTSNLQPKIVKSIFEGIERQIIELTFENEE